MTATWLALALVVLLLLLSLAWLRWRQPAAADSRSHSHLDTLAAWEPQATRVLTTAERLAMRIVVEALPDYLVLAQVPLARFIRVPTRHSYTEWLRRVGQLCPDLLVCDSSSQVLAVIEIRPPAAQMTQRAKARTERMRRVLKAAGIPMHLWIENALPTVAVARQSLLAGHASLTGDAAPGVAATPLAPATAAPTAATPTPAGAADAPDTTMPPPDDLIELREPPPSTWFDELEQPPRPRP